MALNKSFILLFAILLSISLFVDALPRYKRDPKEGCDIARNSEDLGGLPPEITPAGAKFKFLLYASGVQIYRCVVASKAWVFDQPEASLSNGVETVGKHFFQPTPVNGGRATWQSTLDCDNSYVITKVSKAMDSPDGPQNIQWLLTDTISTGGYEAFSDVTNVVRIHTKNGQPPPANECGTEYPDQALYESEYTSEYWFFNK